MSNEWTGRILSTVHAPPVIVQAGCGDSIRHRLPARYSSPASGFRSFRTAHNTYRRSNVSGSPPHGIQRQYGYIFALHHHNASIFLVSPSVHLLFPFKSCFTLKPHALFWPIISGFGTALLVISLKWDIRSSDSMHCRGFTAAVAAAEPLAFAGTGANFCYYIDPPHTAALSWNCSIVVICSAHHSGKFARTRASAKGGGTALPHRATCLLLGYPLPVLSRSMT